MRIERLLFALAIASPGAHVLAAPAASPSSTYEIPYVRPEYGSDLNALPGYRLMRASEDQVAYTFSHVVQNSSALPYGLVSQTVDPSEDFGSDVTDRDAATDGRGSENSSLRHAVTIDVCTVTAQGSSCGAGGDRSTSTSNSDTFALTFTQAKTSANLSDFYAGVELTGAGGQDIEIGAPIPEPAQWLQLLAGLGVVAWTLSRARNGRVASPL